MAFQRKLTPEDVKAIIARRETGEAYGKIAPDFDVSTSRIYELCNPEKQAVKAEKLKAKNAAKKAAKKMSKAEVEDDEIDDMDLAEVGEDAPAEDEWEAADEDTLEEDLEETEVA